MMAQSMPQPCGSTGQVVVSITGPAPVLPSTPPANRAKRQVRREPPHGCPLSPPCCGLSERRCVWRLRVLPYSKGWVCGNLLELFNGLDLRHRFRSAGKPLLGTGNKGLIYRVDSNELSTQLLNAPPTQITAFLQGKTDAIDHGKCRESLFNRTGTGRPAAPSKAKFLMLPTSRIGERLTSSRARNLGHRV